MRKQRKSKPPKVTQRRAAEGVKRGYALCGAKHPDAKTLLDDENVGGALHSCTRLAGHTNAHANGVSTWEPYAAADAAQTNAAAQAPPPKVEPTKEETALFFMFMGELGRDKARSLIDSYEKVMPATKWSGIWAGMAGMAAMLGFYMTKEAARDAEKPTEKK